MLKSSNTKYKNNVYIYICFSFNMSFFSNDSSMEELYCPLCHLSFSNNTSMQMHFDNYQHKERYKNCKEELEFFYKGPFSDLAHL